MKSEEGRKETTLQSSVCDLGSVLQTSVRYLHLFKKPNFFFFKFIYFERARERARKRVRGREQERLSPKQVPCHQHRARRGARTHER